MGLNAKEYRKQLYSNRAHPERANSKVSESSFQGLYLSMPLFIFSEYLLELKVEALPQGILFPIGFLVFWAFYYTYQEPGFLEDQLKSGEKWDLLSIPTVILGSLLWFVKVVVVEFAEVILERWLFDKEKPPMPRQRSAPRPQAVPMPPRPASSALPRDVQTALTILGLTDCRDWSVIHRRYRELAKKFHPDLNPELTTTGNRFMIYDEAYRKLATVKDKHFR